MKTLKNNELKLITLLSSLMILLTFSACDDDDEVIEDPVEDVAYVSLYHASPNAPDLDVFVDNRVINYYPFDYSEYTGYLRFFTGDRNLEIGPYGASNIVEDTTVNFADGNFYSIFLTDNYNQLDVLVLNDDTESPEAGNAKVRFVHLSPDASTVNLTAESIEDPVVENLNFKSATDFMEIEGEEYDFTVRDSETGDMVLSVPDVNLQDGLLYTVIVRGYASPPAGNDNVLSAEIILN